MKTKQESSGFIMTIILIIVALLLLKYAFDIDVIDFIFSGRLEHYIVLGWEFIQNIWENYIASIFTAIWENLMKIIQSGR